jgi:hypothetical protein
MDFGFYWFFKHFRVWQTPKGFFCDPEAFFKPSGVCTDKTLF